ncbi:hypothetical protein LINPERPRIM_LOCUS5292 [Linum perenne]
MGSCFSKKTVSAACPAGEVQQKREEKKEEDEREEKKEVFVIKHRDSHERRSPSPAPSRGGGVGIGEGEYYDEHGGEDFELY